MLKLIQTDWGQFDLAPDDGSDDAAVATLIYAAIHTDAQAPLDRVDDQFNRRGWFANPASGTGLWYVRRQALTDKARLEALNMITNALATRAPGLTDVQVAEVTPEQPAGNVSRLLFDVSGIHNGRKFILRIPL